MGAKLYVRPDRQAYRAGEVLTVSFEVPTPVCSLPSGLLPRFNSVHTN